MKKILNRIGILVLLSGLMACEKPVIDTKQSHKKGYEVRFHIGDIAQKYANGKARAVVGVGEVCSCINAAIYNHGTKVTGINQKKGEEGFGNLKVNLPEGEYSLVIVAHSGMKNASTAHADKISFSGKITDTFLYNGTFTVTEDMQLGVTLTRCVAKVEFNFDKAIPEKVTHLRFNYTGGSSSLDAIQGFGCVNSRQTEVLNVPEEAHRGPSSYGIFTFPKAQEGTLKVKLTALDASNNVVAEHTFNDVRIVMNGINRINGLYFTKPSEPEARGINIKVDDSWATIFDSNL